MWAPLLLLTAAPADAEFFKRHVRPLLVEKCQWCHGAKIQRGGLRLDGRAALLKGGDSGPAVVPGHPEKSQLMKAVRWDGELKMPKKEEDRLTPAQVAALDAWIKAGAAWTDEKVTEAPSPVALARKTHWAYRPVGRPVPPEGGHHPVDAFLLAKLRDKGLTLAPEADRRTLIRRLSFDLVGLPPTPEEVEAFVADPRPDAYERLVERLLASPGYGERWGRHWLDVARYADTRGYVFTDERRFPYSYTYRDYVIAALNADLPYDRFVVEQLAADQLPLGDDKRPLAAMGFLTLGRRFLNNTHDIIDDRIDVVTRGLLGLTVSCARCHDHKFDAVPTRDYYSLYGVFASSVEPRDLPLLGGADSPERPRFEAELARRQAEVDAYVASQRGVLAKRYRDSAAEYLAAAKADRPGDLNRAMAQRWKAWLAGPGKAKDVAAALADPKGPLDLPADLAPYFDRAQRDRAAALRKKVEAWMATGPGAPPRAMVLVDAASPSEPRVLVRGNPGSPGASVPRQFLEVLSEARKPFAKGSGRLELARAIASPDNPLTARVMANRVWMHHFGKGLVRTPSDFGVRGDAPTHPELLDWLAWGLTDGWSLKRLHRVLVTSAAYRQRSDADAGLKADPENRLLWHAERRRLEFEPLRDALLAAAGSLDRRMGGPGVEITAAPYPPRRSVYAFIERQNLPGVFRTFDLASPDATTARRFATTVPQQALFLMNSPFAARQARRFAERAELKGLGDEARVDRMHEVAYGRKADADERAAGLVFVRGAGASGWEQYAQVLLLSNEFAFVD